MSSLLVADLQFIELTSFVSLLVDSRPPEITVEQTSDLLLVSWHEMPVPIEGDRDRRVPHVRRERFGVHAAANSFQEYVG